MIRALAVLCLMSVPAVAQMQPQQCGPVSEMITQLGKRAKEVPMLRGTAGNSNSNGDMLLMGNASSGSWTVLHIQNDRACIVAFGMSLTPMDKPENLEPGI